jgi:hypothetical protein
MTHIDTRTRPAPNTELPLFIPLRREWYEQFERRVKTFEFRPYGPRWNEKTCRIGRRVTLSLGYGKAQRLHGVIVGFWQDDQAIHGDAWKSCYGDKGHKIAARIEIRID